MVRDRSLEGDETGLGKIPPRELSRSDPSGTFHPDTGIKAIVNEKFGDGT